MWSATKKPCHYFTSGGTNPPKISDCSSPPDERETIIDFYGEVHFALPEPKRRSRSPSPPTITDTW